MSLRPNSLNTPHTSTHINRGCTSGVGSPNNNRINTNYTNYTNSTNIPNHTNYTNGTNSTNIPNHTNCTGNTSISNSSINNPYYFAEHPNPNPNHNNNTHPFPISEDRKLPSFVETSSDDTFENAHPVRIDLSEAEESTAIATQPPPTVTEIGRAVYATANPNRRSGGKQSATVKPRTSTKLTSTKMTSQQENGQAHSHSHTHNHGHGHGPNQGPGHFQSLGLERTYSNTTITGDSGSHAADGGGRTDHSQYGNTVRSSAGLNALTGHAQGQGQGDGQNNGNGFANDGSSNGYMRGQGSQGSNQNQSQNETNQHRGNVQQQKSQQPQQSHEGSDSNNGQYSHPNHHQGHEGKPPAPSSGQNHPSQETENTSGLTTAQLAKLPWGAPFPSLHLWPLNETFVMKMIHLPAGQRVKIGRQTNAKTVPAERNGYFDSKVLSRMHAEIWEEDGKIFIKDVKSSNGTFINGDRLSPEGVESEPFELKSEDMIEFGIDIVSEDNKTTLHHKVAAKAYCVFSVDDAGASSRELSQYYPFDPSRSMGPARKSGPNGPAGQGMLTSNLMSAGGKVQGLNFDHMLHKLQTELQKSRDTDAELKSLTAAMSEIQDTLSGGMPPAENGSANKFIPPQFQANGAFPESAMGDTSATIAALQTQLQTTQSILVSHKDRIRQLETMLEEHDAIKDEVLGMRHQLEESKKEIESLVSRNAPTHETEAPDNDEGQHETGSVEVLLEGKPDDGGITDSVFGPEMAKSGSQQSSKRREDALAAQTESLTARLDHLTGQLEEAIQLSSTLQTEHAEATSTVKILEERIQTLEGDVAKRVADDNGQAGRAAEERWEAWRSKFEESWRREREGWDLERERLRGVVREWEEASRRAQEEEEERLMNGRLAVEDDEDAVESEEDDDDEAARERARSSSQSGWLDTEITSVITNMPRRSQSTSPRQTSRPLNRKQRRESSSRLDPAIRALKATAGEDGDIERSTPDSPNGAATPRTASPSAADFALKALGAKSNRAKRAGTITNKKRKNSDGANDSDHTTKQETGKKSGLSKSTSPEDLKEDKDGSETTSTESDETAHVSDNKEDDTTQAAAAPAQRTEGTGGGQIAISHPIPFAISLVVLGVAAWAYVNRSKE